MKFPLWHHNYQWCDAQLCKVTHSSNMYSVTCCFTHCMWMRGKGQGHQKLKKNFWMAFLPFPKTVLWAQLWAKETVPSKHCHESICRRHTPGASGIYNTKQNGQRGFAYLSKRWLQNVSAQTAIHPPNPSHNQFWLCSFNRSSWKFYPVQNSWTLIPD